MPSEVALQSLQNELKGNVFRGVHGFFTKYFEGKTWSAAVQEMIQGTQSADIASKLSANILSLTHFDALVEWLDMLQSQIFTFDQAEFRFRTQLISKPDHPLKASIYLETSNVPDVAGSTRVFGEYHHGEASVLADDDGHFLRFCNRARETFEAQPARLFLHAFLVYGNTLELWVFDRSGVYSSEKLDLLQSPYLLVQALAGYTLMSDDESGLNNFVQRAKPGLANCVVFEPQNKLYLRSEMLAVPDYLVGLGTTCYAASQSINGEPNTVVKFSWREEGKPTEPQLLRRALDRGVKGIIRVIGEQDLGSIMEIRRGLQFPQPFVNRTFSCVATAPLGRPMQKFASIYELSMVLSDFVKALRSLYVDGRMLHRDIAIKNMVMAPRHSGPGTSVNNLMGVLIDFDQALDLDNVHDISIDQMIGSQGFMSIGILTGSRHTYRHDLESLFYVFLWLAIGNDHEHDNAWLILDGLPKASRLRKWCSRDFESMKYAKYADMTPEGFLGVLEEFSADFAPLRDLAKELHGLLFPLRDGKIFIGTEMAPVAVEQLYDGMAKAFERSANTF